MIVISFCGCLQFSIQLSSVTFYLTVQKEPIRHEAHIILRWLFSDPGITRVKETGTSSISPGSSVSFTIVVNNAANIANGNDIKAVSNSDENFSFKLQFSDIDMRLSPNQDTLSSPKASVAITPGDDVRGLSAQNSFTTSGNSTANFASADCPNVKFLCVSLLVGMGASFKDADTTNNIFCDDVRRRIVCSPGTFNLQNI